MQFKHVSLYPNYIDWFSYNWSICNADKNSTMRGFNLEKYEL
jgi:hypothetical protein